MSLIVKLGSEIGDDALMTHPTVAELDERGCYAKESCFDLDNYFLERAEAMIAAYPEPVDPPKGKDPNSKWRVISSMQKAIRFGDVEHAEFCASVAFDIDATYARRRLGVIAVEDVAMGNPMAMSIALAIMGHPHWRKKVGERKLVMWLAGFLAVGRKDRSFVDLCVFAGLSTLDKELRAKWSDDTLIKNIKTSVLTQDKMVYAWLLGGTKRYSGGGMPEDNDRTPTKLFKLMVDEGMSRWLLWVAARTASRLNEAMFVSTLIVHNWLQQGIEFTYRDNTLDTLPTVKVGKLLGAAYDQHTREGQMAIGRWAKSCKELQPFLEKAGDHRKHLLYNGVFKAEGGRLDRQVFYGGAQGLFEFCADGANRYPFLPKDMQNAWLPTIKTHLDELNTHRESVLWQQQSKK